MSSNRDPRRLPVYVDRVNGRLLADPQTGGPWFVISAGSGGGSAPPGSVNEPGILQLEDSVSSTSITKAATPNSVRQAFDLAETANLAAVGAAANASTALNNSQVALTTANSISATANQANSNATTALTTANAATVTANNAANAVNTKLDLSGGTLTGDVIISPSARLGFEGSSDDVFETYLAVANPTADRTITLPNASGTVPLLESSNTWSSAQVFNAGITFTNGSVSSQLNIGPNAYIVFEGATDDAFETFVYANDPTQDRSIYLPNADGTVALLETLANVAKTGAYGDLINRPTLGTAAALDVNVSGNASATQVVRGNDTRLTTNLSYDAGTRVLGSSTGTGPTLPLVANATAGLAPASGGGTDKFLRADGTWGIPPGSLGTDGDRGDITVSGGGTTWTIDNGAVTYSKMQAVSVGNRILGKAGSTPGTIEEIPCTQVGRDLIGASDNATQRVLLGLGALAQQDSIGFISSTGTIGSLAGRPVITTTGGAITTGTFGTGAGTFCSGDDSRLSDSRTTPGALTVIDNGTGVASGTTFNGSVARTISYNSIGAAAGDHVHGNIKNNGAIGTTANLPVITGTNGLLTTGSFGTTVNTFCQGNDSRLSDARQTANAITFDNSGVGVVSGTTFNGSTARTVSWNTVGAASSGHGHGQITNGGAIGVDTGKPIITGAGGVLQAGTFGTTAGTFCAGDDSRLSNTRDTSNPLTFNSSGTGASSGTTFNGSVGQTISFNTIGAAASNHVHGNISNAGAIGTTSGLPIITTTSGVLTTGSFGTTSGTFCQGNDSRLSDTRNTTNTLTFNNGGVGAASGATFNGSAGQTISFNTIGAASSSHTHGNITNAGAIGSISGLPIITTTGGVLTTGSFGSSAGSFCQGNDSRLSDTRNTPNSITLSNAGNGSASGTAFNGSGAVIISYNSIGAAPTNGPAFTGFMETGPSINTGRGATAATGIAIGAARANNDSAYLDFVSNAATASSGTGFEARIIRPTGANAELEIINSGANGSIFFNQNGARSLGITGQRLAFNGSGVVDVTTNARWAGILTGGASTIYHDCVATANADSTGNASAYSSSLSTATAASPVTFTALTHFDARGTVGKGANTTITNQFGFRVRSTLTAATNNYGFYSDIATGAGQWNFYANGTASNYFNGTIISLGSYNSTTSNPANVNIDSFGNIQRVGSSLRYKTDIEDLDAAYADNVIFNARPVWYRSTTTADNKDWSWYGLIAEELAELDPRLVTWGFPTKEVMAHEAKDEVLDEDGNVLEPAQKAVYRFEPDVEAGLRPEGIAYERLGVLLIDVVQRQQEKINELEAAIGDLRETVNELRTQMASNG